MSESEQTVREVFATCEAMRTYLAAVESMTRSLGNEEWQDEMTNVDFWWYIVSDNPIGAFLRMDGMAPTLRQIQALPETP